MIPNTEVPCPLHKSKPLEFFCKQCKIPICNSCQIVNHQGHQISTVDEALDAMKPSLNSDVQKLSDIIAAGTKALKVIEHEMTELTTSKESTIESIGKEINRLKSALTTKQKSLEESIAAETDKQVN